jgi:hypothetical protein
MDDLVCSLRSIDNNRHFKRSVLYDRLHIILIRCNWVSSIVNGYNLENQFILVLQAKLSSNNCHGDVTLKMWGDL